MIKSHGNENLFVHYLNENLEKIWLRFQNAIFKVSYSALVVDLFIQFAALRCNAKYNL